MNGERGIVPPWITAAVEAGLCTCDAFPEPHTPGLIEGGVYCETLYTEPTVSPHLYGVPPPPAPVEPAGVITIKSFTAFGNLFGSDVQCAAAAQSVPWGGVSVGHFLYEAVDGTSLVPATGLSNWMIGVPFAPGYAPAPGTTLDVRATWVPDDPAAWTAPTATATATMALTQQGEAAPF